MFIIFGLLETSALVEDRPRKKMYTIFSVSKNLKRKRFVNESIWRKSLALIHLIRVIARGLIFIFLQKRTGVLYICPF